MRRLSSCLALSPVAVAGAALLLLAGTARGDEEAAKAAFVACQSMDLAACNQLVTMGGLSDVVRARAYVLRGVDYIKSGDLTNAKADIAEALKLDPGSQPAAQVSKFIEQIGQQQAATPEMRCFQAPDLPQRLAACNDFISKSAADPQRQAMAYDGRAAAEMEAESFPEAIDDLQAAHRLDPQLDGVMDHLMLVEFQAGHYDDALKSADAALQEKPGDAGLLQQRGVLFYLTGQPLPALADLQASSQQTNADLTRFMIDVIHLEQHQDVKDDLRQQLTSPTMNSFGAAILRFRLGEVPATAVLDEAAKLPPEQKAVGLSQAYFNIGHQAWLDGDLPTARDNLSLAVKEHHLESFDYHAAKMILQKIPG